MRIVKVTLEKHTPYSHDIVKIKTLEGNEYRIMDWEIEQLLSKNEELLAEDKEFEDVSS